MEESAYLVLHWEGMSQHEKYISSEMHRMHYQLTKNQTFLYKRIDIERVAVQFVQLTLEKLKI